MTDQLKAFDSAIALLPSSLRQTYAALREDRKARVEELRLRIGAPPALRAGAREQPLNAPTVTASDVSWILERASRGSLHSVADELREGFITVRGGHRLGIAGTAVMHEDAVHTIRGISSLSLRIAREHRSCAEGMMARLMTGGFASTLLVSPPGVGKTTYLRDCIRILSESGLRIGVADERREIAAMWEGQPQFDLGPCTDVLEGAPKARAAAMLLRTMTPDVLAVDEITAAGDVEALAQAVNCGVRLLATVHGRDIDDVLSRPALRDILRRGQFASAVILERAGEERRTFRIESLQ